MRQKTALRKEVSTMEEQLLRSCGSCKHFFTVNMSERNICKDCKDFEYYEKQPFNCEGCKYYTRQHRICKDCTDFDLYEKEEN